MSNVFQLRPQHPSHRPAGAEAHADSRDRTLAVLLEQAVKIKEEVAAGLQRSEGSAHARALSRTLLQSHILTVTRIVQQLSVHVQTLERQIAERDSTMHGTTQAVQRLDHKNVVGIGDLRGRVARCDASISSLSVAVSSSLRQLTRLQQEVARLRSAVDAKMSDLQVKRQRDLGRLEATLAEAYQAQRGFIMDTQNQIGKVENQLSAKITEAMQQSSLLQKCIEQQIRDCVQTFGQSNQRLQDKMEEAERGLHDRLRAVETRLEQSEARAEMSRSGWAEQLKGVETNQSKRVRSLEHSLHQELQLLKQNYHKGFKSVHDAIESLKDIMELKHRLEKGTIQKEINLICSELNLHAFSNSNS